MMELKMTGWPHNAYVGQKVVCIKPSMDKKYKLILNEVYTIASIGFIHNEIAFNLAEMDIIGIFMSGCSADWYASRFRPVQSTETGMSILRKLLVPNNKLEKV